jgi:hypothetical protein
MLAGKGDLLMLSVITRRVMLTPFIMAGTVDS